MKKHLLVFSSATLLLFACSKTDTNVISGSDLSSTDNLTGGRVCASDEVLQQQIASDPARAQFLEELESFTKNYPGRDLSRGTGTLYVPVVVNVVLPNPNQVTNTHIQSQIDVLNKDFSKTNSELTPGVYLAGYNLANVANCDIKFVVTNVVRKTASGVFGTNDAVKKSSQGGQDPTSPTTKMNMWVCDLSSGYLGYAQFPGGSAATDGVVIDYQAFGLNSTAGYPMYTQFNKGRTATHEVGHWVNLRHIWGDRRCGDDLVGDTPAHDASNGGCPATNHVSKCAGRPLEQWMNYMDYTDDACMYMFSSGQKTRMDAAIDGSRRAYFVTSTPTSVL